MIESVQNIYDEIETLLENEKNQSAWKESINQFSNFSLSFEAMPRRHNATGKLCNLSYLYAGYGPSSKTAQLAEATRMRRRMNPRFKEKAYAERRKENGHIGRTSHCRSISPGISTAEFYIYHLFDEANRPPPTRSYHGAEILKQWKLKVDQQLANI